MQETTPLLTMQTEELGKDVKTVADFTNLVMEYKDDGGTFKAVAGRNRKWHRPMIISDCEMPDVLRGKQASLLCPAGALQRELQRGIENARNKNIQIGEIVNEASAVVEYYVSQKAVRQIDRNLIVVCSHEHFTDITYMRKERSNWSIIETQRLDTMLKADSQEGMNLTTKLPQGTVLLMNQITGETRKILFRKKIGKAVVILSGDLWEDVNILTHMRKRLEPHTILAYKASEAALLGAVLCCRKDPTEESSVYVDDRYMERNHHNVLGKAETLSELQQNGFWKMVSAIQQDEEEVSFEGNGDDLSSIYSAISVDVPELIIRWSYSKSSYVNQKWNNRPAIKMTLFYCKEGKERMKRIEQKAEQILTSCIGSGKNLLSDREIIKRLYLYMSEHYHYTNEKTPDGKYPDYAYTLETLLRCGVCQGYALSMVYLLRKLQIPVLYIRGDAHGKEFGGHAWNLIRQPDGNYRHLDVTWDLEKGGRVMDMKYYIADDMAMRARRHFWKAADYPACI